MAKSFCWLLALVTTPVWSFVPGPRPLALREVCVFSSSGGSGFGEKKPSRKSGQKSTQKLRPEDGWVELKELDVAALTAGGPPQAVGRSITGKPYLVRRLPNGDVAATGVECGRCLYPLLKSTVEQVPDDDDDEFETFEVTCTMCGATFDAADGTVRSSSGAQQKKGGGFFAPLLRSKPQKAISAYPTKEVGNAVFVNVTPM